MGQGVFDLEIPSTDLVRAQEAAKKAGCRLLSGETEGSFVLLGPRLPAVLAPYMKQEALNKAFESQKATRLSRAQTSDGTTKKRVLDIPFAERSIAQKFGAHWDRDRKCWVCSDQNEALLQLYTVKPFSWEWLCERELNADLPQTIRAQGTPFELRPHQTEAVQLMSEAYLKKIKGFLLADEVGLGKTLSAWQAVVALGKTKKISNVLIVAPLSVLPNWRETILRVGSPFGKILTINYERLSKLFEAEAGSFKTKKGLARKGIAQEWDLIIFDEAHKLKNMQSARSKFASKLTQQANFTIWMSATAGQTPLELSYLAPLLAQKTASRAASLKDFELWCQSQGFGVKRAKFGVWEWDGSKKDCAQLSNLLFNNKPISGLRRLPQDIAGWPELSRQLCAQDLNSEQRQLYEQSWVEFKSSFLNKDFLLRTKKGLANKSVNMLVEALRFRQKSSLLRMDATVELALDLLDNGIKPVISCAFLQTVTELKKLFEKASLRVSVVGGKQSSAEREQERLDFQKGKTQVVLFTIEEGISLHQGEYEDVPRALLIHDLRWSAIQMAQIEGRAHRNGKFAQAYWLAGSDTVEAKIAQRVSARTASLKALVGDEDENLEKEIITMLWSLSK